MDKKDKLIKAFSEFLDNHTGGSKQDKPSFEVHKAIDDEKRKALFIVLEPTDDGSGLTTDLHGDIYTEEEVEKACDNFNRYCAQPNIQHLVNTQEAEILESYIAVVGFELDTGETIKKGSWLQTWAFPDTDAGNLLWSGVKDGTFTGLSIGANATVEEL